MTTSKRAIKSITKRPVETIILLVIVIILGSVMAGAISVQNATDNTVFHFNWEYNFRASITHNDSY